MPDRVGMLSSWARWSILLAGCAIFFFIWPGGVPLTEADEARFTEASREMIESGNWVIPYFDYIPRYRKPVLFYWLQAGSMAVFGQNENAARLPSALASTALVIMLYGFLTRKMGPADEKDGAGRRGAAFLGAASLVIVPLVAFWSRAAVTDPLLTLWITASLLCLLQSDMAASEKRGAGRWFVLAGAFSGLAFLTKGPIGLAIPGGTWLLYHLLQRDLGRTAKSVPWIKALGSFIIVALPWYLATYIVDGPAFLKWFFLHENVERYTSTMEGHGAGNPILGLLTYPLIALITLFPVSPFLVREMASPFGGNSSEADDRMRRMRRFALSWIFVVIAIFSLSRTQLPAYIQSISGAAAILFAVHMYARFRVAAPKRSMLEAVLLVLIGLIWLSLPLYVLPKGSVPSGRIGTANFPQPLATGVMWVCTAGGTMLLVGAVLSGIKKSDRMLVGSAMVGWTVLLGGLVLGVAPMVIGSIYQPTKTLGLYLAALPKDTRIAVCLKKSPESLVFYSRRKIDFWDRTDPETPKMTREAVEKGCVFVTDDEGLKAISRLGPVRFMRTFGKVKVAYVSTAKEGTR